MPSTVPWPTGSFGRSGSSWTRRRRPSKPTPCATQCRPRLTRSASAEGGSSRTPCRYARTFRSPARRTPRAGPDRRCWGRSSEHSRYAYAATASACHPGRPTRPYLRTNHKLGQRREPGVVHMGQRRQLRCACAGQTKQPEERAPPPSSQGRAAAAALAPRAPYGPVRLQPNKTQRRRGPYVIWN